MWVEALLLLMALSGGALVWEHERRRIDRRVLDEERRTAKDQFARPHLSRWRRHRWTASVLTAAAALTWGWLLAQFARLLL
jgi:hypothetical protein